MALACANQWPRFGHLPALLCVTCESSCYYIEVHVLGEDVYVVEESAQRLLQHAPDEDAVVRCQRCLASVNDAVQQKRLAAFLQLRIRTLIE